MNQKSEISLLCLSNLMIAAPVMADNEVDQGPMVDFDLDTIPERETLPPITIAAYDLLESIKSEEEHFQLFAQAVESDDWEAVERKRDEGLTSEINKSVSLMGLDEVVDRCTIVLERHPFGFTGFGKSAKGVIKPEP